MSISITQIFVIWLEIQHFSSAEVALAVSYRGQHSVARYTVVYYGILWYTVVYSGVLWYTVVYCGILWYTVVC